MMKHLRISLALCLSLAASIANAQNTLNNGLLAVYSFDGCTLDLSENSRDAGLLGSASLQGDVLQIPRDDSSALSRSGVFLNGLSDMSIAFQVTFTAFNLTGSPQAPSNTIISISNDGLSDALLVAYAKPTNTFQIIISNTLYAVSNVNLNAGQSYCIEIVRNSGMVELYIDGVETGPGATIMGALTIAGPGFLVVGQNQNCAAGCFVTQQSLNGSIDNLRFYNRALLATELAAYCASPADEDRAEDRTAMLCEGKKVLLDVTIPEQPTATYRWQDNSTDPVFEASERGDYAAEVSFCGQTVTYNFDVSRMENCPCEPRAPKAFTPNGDDKNDAFKVLNDCVFREFSLQIYNRWGKMVFETRNPETFWDGTSEGEAQPSDVYIYNVRYKIKENEAEFTFKGDVSLLR